jgi:hypothetical protein
VRAGVIDPTKVVSNALQNAASIASLLLTTEAVVSRIPEDGQESATSGSSDAGFGGTELPLKETSAGLRGVSGSARHRLGGFT